MKHRILKNIFCLSILFMHWFGLSGCATSTTIQKEELYPKIVNCRTKSCLQSFNLKKINSFKSHQGEYVEMYKLPEEPHTAAYTTRQVGHGVMSLATLGLWEIAYYQIEDSLELDTFTVDAIYQSPTYIKKIEIANAAGGVIRSSGDR